MENQIQEQQLPVPEKTISSMKKQKIFMILILTCIVLLPFLFFGIKYVHQSHPTPSITVKTTSTKLVAPTITPCSPALEEGNQTQSLMWKTYTCQPLGITFQYPTNIKPSIPGYVVRGTDNYIDIDYGLMYIVRITKFTTSLPLTDWWNQNISTHVPFTTTQTIFHGYPALLAKETPETIQNVQVPENAYIVKINSSTLYKIEYAVPDPHIKLSATENTLMTTGIQKILDSITFLPANLPSVVTPSPSYTSNDLYFIKVSTSSAVVLPQNIYYLDQYIYSLFGTNSQIVYDTREGSPYLADPYNFLYYLLTNTDINIQKVYGTNGISIRVSRPNPQLLPYLIDSKYCSIDSDCVVRTNFCSYGGFNSYSNYKAIWGCGPPLDVDAPNGPSEFEVYDNKKGCSTEVTYTNAKCINNECIGQNRTVSCMK